MKLWEIDSQVMRLMKGMISGEGQAPSINDAHKGLFRRPRYICRSSYWPRCDKLRRSGTPRIEQKRATVLRTGPANQFSLVITPKT